MSIEDTSAPEPDQPAVVEAPPEEGTSAPEFFSENFDPSKLEAPLQERYKQMHADYTRKTQEVAEQRREAETGIKFISALQSETDRSHALKQLVEVVGEDAVLEALGIELADTEETESDDTEPEFRDPRVDELLAEREQLAQQQELDQLEASIDTGIDALAKSSNISLDDDEKELIWDKVLSLPPNADGSPQIEAAFRKVTGIRERYVKQYAESKKAAAPPVQGSSGTPSIPPGDDKARRLSALEIANRAYGSSS